MFDPLTIVDCGVKYYHPLVILLAILAGSWVPGITRFLTTAIRSLSSLLRRL